MNASIVVCTYNRAELLKGTLAALARLEAPPARSWEVLIVDNNSRDHTKQVVESVQQKWPRLRYVFEQAQGLSHARNRGITEAGGEDGEMFERILAAGYKAVFLGQSRVHHKVEAFRLTKGYFRRWRFQTSRNIAQSRGLAGDRRLFNIPLFVFPQLMRAVMRMVWGRLTLPRDEAFNREIIVFHFLGLIQGLYRVGAGS